jgi:DNA-binding response OmpR family regulator
MHIGLVEDDVDQRDLICMWLESAQHQVEAFGTGRELLDSVKQHSYDLLVVDWMLPDYNGGAVIKWVRENVGWDLPVMVVTVRDSEADIVAGLRAGADDYLVKPLRAMELLARVEAMARRGKSRKVPVIHAGLYEIDFDRRLVRVRGEPVELTQKELDLAYYLFSNPGKLFSRVHLLERIWGLHADVDTRTVDTHVSRLRRKLKFCAENGWQLTPVYGYGYRMERMDQEGTA